MDFSYLDTISDGDQKFIEQFIRTFRSNTADLVNSLQTAYSERRYEDMKKLAHKLKPSLIMLNLDCTHVALDIMDDPGCISDADLKELEEGCEEAVQSLMTQYGPIS